MFIKVTAGPEKVSVLINMDYVCRVEVCGETKEGYESILWFSKNTEISTKSLEVFEDMDELHEMMAQEVEFGR